MDVEDVDWDEEEEEERWNEPVEPHLEGVRLAAWQDLSHHSATADASMQADKKPSVPPSSDGSTSIMSRMALNDNKAGMDGLDKEKINKIIMQASKGSRFYENERKKEAQVNQRIERMMQQLAGITEQQKAAASVQVDAMVAVLEASRDFSRSIVHLDMDAFYAAVEMRDDPSLRDKPMAVGGIGMLSTSNYHARRYGVRAAMPGFIGKKLCPDLVIVPTHFDKYHEVSGQVREILAQYDPNFCPMSLDEAYFDLTDHLERRKSFTEAERTFEYGSWNQDVTQNNGGDAKLSDTVNSGQDRGKGRDESSSLRTSASLPDDQCPHLPENPEQDSLRLNKSLATGVVSGSSLPSAKNQSDLSTQLDSVDSHTKPALDTSDHCIASSGASGSRNPPMEAVPPPKRRCRTFGFTVEEAVEEIRFRIEQKTQLTASAGIAPNIMLAKICSDKNKPNGQYRIQPNRDAVMEFIRELPIRKVSGIGKVTEKMLVALGIQNCTDLYQQRALLHLLFSQISSQHFLRISLGLGSTKVERDGERKSMSTERTFRELHRPADLYSKCSELCEALAEDLQREDLVGKTVTIKLKTVKFEVKTKACSVPTCINSADNIFNVAKDLLRAEISACKPEPLRLRLMGVRLSNLQLCSAAANKQDSITKFFKKQQTQPSQMASPHQFSEALPAANGLQKMQGRDSFQNTAATDLSLDSEAAVGTSFTAPPKQETVRKPTSDTHAGSSVFQPHTEDQRLLGSSYNHEKNHEDCKSEENVGKEGTDGQEASLIRQLQEEPLGQGCEGAPSEFVCPVCNIPQPSTDLESFNEHVDLCLNRGAIRDMLRQQASEEKPSSSQKSVFPLKGKRSLSGPKSAPKRQKQGKTQTATLDKFFG